MYTLIYIQDCHVKVDIQQEDFSTAYWTQIRGRNW
jgi:hypothetical protein